jgi:FkbM family methyltransferase
MKAVLELTKRLPEPVVNGLMRVRLNPLLRPAMDWVASRMKNQDSVIQRGVGRGLKFNPGGSNASYLLGTLELGIQEALQLWLRPGMTVYDIGANVGFLTVIAARLVGASGRVLAFEPVPALADQSSHNARLNRFDHVSVYRTALSDADGDAVFQVSENLTMGKLGSSGSRGNGLMVKRNRLDTLVNDGRFPDPSLVKIDVEGAEPEVLDGAIEVLRRARPMLLIELHSTNQAVADRLDRLGYIGRELGTSRSIRNCAPNTCIAAVPEERNSMLQEIPAALGQP